MTIDPILTNVNAAADRRLMDDVMNAPDPFDGGCAHDCSDRGTVAKPASVLTEDDLPDADRHVINMCACSFELGWIRCYRQIDAIIDALPIDAIAKVEVLLAILHMPGKPSSDAAAAHRRDQVKTHLRLAAM